MPTTLTGVRDGHRILITVTRTNGTATISRQEIPVDFSPENTCARPKCRMKTGHTSGYCSDVCLQLDQDFDIPALVLSPGKAGGFGRALHWADRTPVHIPRQRRP